MKHTCIYYIHTVKYSPKIYVVNVLMQIIWVLANQRSKQWFSHVNKMIGPIKIANDVFHVWEKNTSNQKTQRCVSFTPKFPPLIGTCSLQHPLRRCYAEIQWKEFLKGFFLSKKKWKTSQKLELNSICLFHCRWRKLWRAGKTTSEGKNRMRHNLKGTQSAVGLHWPGHYFCQFEKHLPQPTIKCTCRIHLEIRFNLA